MTTYLNYIDGKFIPHNGEFIEVLNPATKEVISRVASASLEDTKRAIEAAKKAQKVWEAKPAIERANHLKEIASLIRKNANFLTEVLMQEQGKTRVLASIEINFTADYMDYTAPNGLEDMRVKSYKAIGLMSIYIYIKVLLG